MFVRILILLMVSMVFINAQACFRFQGKVVDANGYPLENRQVFIFSDSFFGSDIPAFPRGNLESSDQWQRYTSPISNTQGNFVLGDCFPGLDFKEAKNATFGSYAGFYSVETSRIFMDIVYELPPMREGYMYTMEIPYRFAFSDTLQKVWIVIVPGDSSNLRSLINSSSIYLTASGEVTVNGETIVDARNQSHNHPSHNTQTLTSTPTTPTPTPTPTPTTPNSNSTLDYINFYQTSQEVSTFKEQVVFVADLCQGGITTQTIRTSETFEKRLDWELGAGFDWLRGRIWGHYGNDHNRMLTIDVTQEVTTPVGKHLEYTVVFQEVRDVGGVRYRLRNQVDQDVPFKITTTGRYTIRSRDLGCY